MGCRGEMDYVTLAMLCALLQTIGVRQLGAWWASASTGPSTKVEKVRAVENELVPKNRSPWKHETC